MEITFPQNFDPVKVNKQALEVLNHPARFKVLNWHRKCRKTTLAVSELIRYAAKFPAPFWYVGPSYGLAKDTIWSDPRMLPAMVPGWHDPQMGLIARKETDLTVEFLHSHGKIHIYGADRPDLMRGPNPQGVVLDEFSVQKREVWTDVIQPIMRSNPSAWAMFLFTPKGKNHAYEVFGYGQRRLNNEWMSWKQDITESGVFDPNQIEAMKETTPARTFSQEYLCEFLEGEGQVFRGVKEVAVSIPTAPQEGHFYVMGLDLARTTDFTVMAVYDRTENRQVFQDRFNNISWPLQKSRIMEVARKYNNALVIVDATGVGDPIYEDLARAGLMINPYKITSSSKEAMIEKLSLFIEQRTIKIINIPETISEFDDFAYEESVTGVLRYGAPEGRHDDCFLAGTKVLTPEGNKPIEELGPGDLVVTRKGSKPIIFSRSSIKRTIKSPLGITGTPNHPVFTKKGLKPLSEVRDIDIIYIWNEKLLSMEERNTTVTQHPPEDISGFTSGNTMVGKNHPFHYTDKYGSTTLDKLRRGITSTTKTATLLTIPRKIWSLSRRATTFAWKCLNLKLEKEILTGQKNKVKDFIYLLLTGKINNPVQKGPVWSVIQNSYLRLTQAVDSVRRIASRETGREELGVVYNLQIADAPEYFANNILVHNCVIAHALAVSELHPISKPVIMSISRTPIQRKYESAKRDQYAEDEERLWSDWEQG